MSNSNERAPLSGDDLAAYRHIRESIEGLLTTSKIYEQKRTELSREGVIFPEKLLEIGKSKLNIVEVQMPALASKKLELESQLLRSLSDHERANAAELSDLVSKKILSRKDYEDALLNLAKRHVRFRIIEDEPSVKKQPDPKPASAVVFESEKTTKKTEQSIANSSNINRSFKIIDIAQVLGWKVYPESGITPDGALIRRIALELGIEEAKNRLCRFTRDEVEQIKAKLVTEKAPEKKVLQDKVELTKKPSEAVKTITFMGKEIDFSNRATTVLKILQILEKHSESNPISKADLAKETFGDSITPNDAINRVIFQICNLKYRLKNLGFEIGHKKDNNPEINDAAHRALYYVIDNNPKKEQEMNAEPLTNEEAFILTKRLLFMWVKESASLANLGVNVQSLTKELDISILMREVQGRLDSGKLTPNFERTNIESLIPKLRYFADHKTDYMISCSRPVQVLLRCFNGAKIDDELLKKVFSTKNIINVSKANQELRTISVP